MAEKFVQICMAKENFNLLCLYMPFILIMAKEENYLNYLSHISVPHIFGKK